jgi:hypothetical protein
MMNLYKNAGNRSELLFPLYMDLTNPIPRFIVRDFVYSEEEIIKQQQDLEVAGTTEKELWVRRVQNFVCKN